MNFMTDQQDGQAGGGGGDLNDVLAEGDSQFMTGEGAAKKPQGAQTMALFGLIAIAAGVVYFMYFKNGPASAEASAADVASTQTAANVTEFLASGEQHMKLMREMLKDTDKVVERFHQYPHKTQVPLASLRKNPFKAILQVSSPVAESDAAARRRLEAERVEVTDAVRKLNLQSIMAGGATKACMINGKLYQPGQQVDGFAIEEVATDGVVVGKKGFRFKLSMKR